MKVNAKRSLSLIMVLALFLAIPLVSVQEADAASSKSSSKVYLPVEVKERTQGDTIEENYYRFEYNKKGLCTKEKSSYGDTVNKYNKKGVLLSWKGYDNGVLTNRCSNTLKSGRIVKSVYYYFEEGKRSIYLRETFKYKKGKLSKSTYKQGDTFITTDYRADGTVSKSVTKYTDGTGTSLYDKKGNLIKNTFKYSGGTSKHEYKNTYTKGKLTKTVSTYTDEQGSTTKDDTVVYKYKKGKLSKKTVTNGKYSSTTTYTYNKAGLLTKVEQKHGYKGSGKLTNRVTIKYKKIPVDKAVKKAVTAKADEFIVNHTEWL